MTVKFLDPKLLPKEPPRDWMGRPKVVPPDGGDPVPYTRCTTFVDVLENRFNLEQWKTRMVAIGLNHRRDLLLQVAANSGDSKEEKRALNKICSAAIEAAEASKGSNIGTALHKIVAKIDLGIRVGRVPSEFQNDLKAYEETRDQYRLETVGVEEFGVLDELRVGGTRDRRYGYNGIHVIGDVKTGDLDFGQLKMSMQLAVYARMEGYDVETGKRLGHDPLLNPDWGLIIHLPAGEGRCEPKWIDLRVGWEYVALCAKVRESRNIGKELWRPCTPPNGKVLT